MVPGGAWASGGNAMIHLARFTSCWSLVHKQRALDSSLEVSGSHLLEVKMQNLYNGSAWTETGNLSGIARRLQYGVLAGASGSQSSAISDWRL